MGRFSQGYLVHMLDLEVNEWVLCADTAETHAEIRGLRPGHLYRYRGKACEGQCNEIFTSSFL
jgi:hypothetical protein